MVRDRPQRKSRSKPRFERQESWRYTRVSESWRRPRGKSSRMRIRRRGWPSIPAIGYKGPRKYRGLHPSGFHEKLIHRPEELDGLSPERDVVRIAATVGERKRVKISDQAQRLGLRVLNLKAQKSVEVEAAPLSEVVREPSETTPEIQTAEEPEEAKDSETVSKE